MSSNVMNTRWDALLRWTQGHSDQQVSKCVQDVEALCQLQNGTDVASLAWQLISWPFRAEVPLDTAEQKFAEFKRRLLVYLEEAPRGQSFTVEQLQGIQEQIDANTTLAEMWNCTKKYYFGLSRQNRVTHEFPDYVFGFSYFGTLVERVRKIKDQIEDLNRPRSLAFRTTSQWVLRNTHLTHAFVPEMITNQFTNITFLDMSHNRFKTLGDLSHLNRLKVLLLINNRLREIVAAHLPVSLEGLDLDRNQLDEVPDLTRLTELTSLDVSNNRLDEISSDNLPASLTNLNVRNNPLDSIANIREAFPDLEIESDFEEVDRPLVESNPLGESDSEESVVRQPPKRRKR
jgi:hypothetical protein